MSVALEQGGGRRRTGSRPAGCHHRRRRGSIELGLRRELVDLLEQRLAELPLRRRGAVAWYPADVSVIASIHGLPDRPVRDAVLRKVLDG